MLNEILLDLNDKYGVQISVNAALSNGCSISIKKEYQSMDQVMQALADACKLKLVKIGQVYAFRTPTPTKDKPKIIAQKSYLYQGTVREYGTDEVLPFAVVSLGDRNLVTDENGNFSIKSSGESENLSFRSLGYMAIDTTVTSSNQLKIYLRPRITELEEVIVFGQAPDEAITNVGEGAGRIQLNNITNNLVPGLSNNLVFNNLRLYPGVMAAGESIADFVIWGSYAGQSHVIYDGISLFNSWGINDDMGRVNPYMVKHVEVYKGGYNVLYGDRIGGVVLIDGKSGNPNTIASNFSVTNQLINGHVNLPLLNKTSSLQLAVRQSFEDPFSLSAEFEEDLNLIVPKYEYRDVHLKFTSQIDPNNLLEISSLISTDTYRGRLGNRFGQGQALIRDINIGSDQIGASINYSRNWRGGGSTSLMFSTVDYRPELTTNYFISRNINGPTFELRSDVWNNPVRETRSEFSHRIPSISRHQFQLNAEYVSNEVVFESGSPEGVLNNRVDGLERIGFAVHDDVQWSDNFSMQLGLKVDVPEALGKAYWQPRVNGRLDLDDRWNIHFGWGHYNQFIVRNTVVDTLRNRTDVWQVADGGGVPALKAVHHVIGLGYKANNFELNLEGFYKTSEGFVRYLINRNEAGTRRFESESRARGLDMFIKKTIDKYEFWLSYSLAKVEERFVNLFRLREDEFRLAPQSQQHELKAAAMFNFGVLSFSLANAYGSGFPNFTLTPDEVELEPYWRTDLAVQYQFNIEGQPVEAGLSILNLFNRRNVRLNQSVNIPGGDRINTAGIPFTSTVYFNMSF
ncbi:hypothetical protein BFP71_18500 [Roseivirga misakiensis]|uniref:TonB-dependent receptor plug domain-containing protein n=1 Tax=Roseivirga misakiensis TaxID=1563681 RepID=A0A1E5T1X7_9BACT|nr:hypothetical protein BFP71_18500 [Roseivirga misakiensis]